MMKQSKSIFVLASLLAGIIAAQAALGGVSEISPAVVNPAVRSAHQTYLSLDGEWTFRTDPGNTGEKEAWFLPGAAWPNARPMPVPGCWEAQGIGKPGEHNLLSSTNLENFYVEAGMKGEYEGIAWYRKEVAIPGNWAGKQVWIKFGGVNAAGTAYVNGRRVASLGGPGQYCGTYKYNVTDLVRPGEPNTIVVMVRNDVPSNKGGRVVARRYGGIDRSVELEATPEVLIDYADVLPDAARQTATVNVTLRNVAARKENDCAIRIVVRDADGKEVGRTADLPAKWTGKTKTRRVDIALSPCKLWSPEDPALHTAEVTLLRGGKAIHGWTERFGVVNWSTRGSDIFMNGKKFFVRGIGFDAHWPLDVCFPADRAKLREFVAKVKSFGFNHIRTWAHTPTPEFCEAADEAGVSLTVELPYYHSIPNNRQGHHWDLLPKSYDRPQEDLEELLAHYRRYPSIFTISGGNEGDLHVKDRSLPLKTVHAQAPGKLWIWNSGHIYNNPHISDYNCDYFARATRDGKYIPGTRDNFPHVLHEYYNPAFAFDPRNAAKYTGGYLPPIPLEMYRKHVEGTGLRWSWAEAAIEAGQEMMFDYQKVATENARLISKPVLNGYNMWGSVNGDTHFFAQQEGGLLDPFLGLKKGGTPEHFQLFNRPAVLLSKITPRSQPHRTSIVHAHGSPEPKTQVFAEQVVFVSGQAIDIDFWLSNFGESAIHGKMQWSIGDGEKILMQGATKCAVPQGGLASVFKTTWSVPELSKAVRLTVSARLNDSDVENRWDIWAFPRSQSYSRKVAGIGATEKVYEILKSRYPGLLKCQLDNPLASDVKLLVTDNLSAARAACDQGKRVLLVSLAGFNVLQPPVYGGEWVPNMQEGTAMAAGHPVFRGFPCKDYLEPVFTRLVKDAALMTPAFKNVEPIMVGAARIPGPTGRTLPDYLVHAFEASAGKGQLLATGLDLLGDSAEAACLLDGFLVYAGSDAFNPQGRFDFKAAMTLQDNGLGDVLMCAKAEPYELFLGKKNTSLTRLDHPTKPLVWKTTPAIILANGKPWEVVCFVGMGAADTKQVTYTLSVDDKPVADIPVSMTSQTWSGKNGIRVSYEVMESATGVTSFTVFADMEQAMGTGKKSTQWQSSGILRIAIPASLLTANRPVRLKVEGKDSAGRGWFGLIDNHEKKGPL